MSEGLSRRGFLIAAGATAAVAAATRNASPFGVAVTAARADTANALAAIADLRYGMFNHFNLGTFTDEEWAAPNQNPAIFAPSAVNCGQWADAAKASGMKFGVLTTKHHDGFALWPTKFGSQNVANSGYKSDIVKAYTDAFRARGLRVGLYFSIWDRTYPVQAYGGHVDDKNQTVDPSDSPYVLGQIRELLTNYGTIDMLITDGWAWQMGQQALQMQQVRNLVKSLQPNCIMVDHGGLSQPWLGDAIYFEEPLGVRSPAGNTYASLQGQTISNGWFWHPSTPSEALMSKADILGHLTDLEGKYTTFLLNCPPNRNGVLDTNIVNRLAEVGAAWQPNTARAALPTQPLKVEWPVTPAAAYATAYHAGEPAANAIDGRSDANWESCWSTYGLALPQAITIDLGGVWSNVSTLQYLPKQFNRSGATDGDITSYSVSTSTDGVAWTQVASGTWPVDAKPKLAEWAARDVGFVRLQATAAAGGYVNVGGLIIGGRTTQPVRKSTLLSDTTIYRIENRNSGQVLDVYNFGTADGTSVQQWGWSGAACQQFVFLPTGDGYYKIRDQNSKKLIEVAGLSRDNGGVVDLWRDANAFQQQWAITPTGDGYVVFQNRFSGRSLDVVGASKTAGTKVDQWDYNNATQEQWKLVAVGTVATTTPVSGNGANPTDGSGRPGGSAGGATTAGGKSGSQRASASHLPIVSG